MVRKWIIMIVLSVILVFGCIFESTYVNRSFDWLINSLETIQIELAESKDKLTRKNSLMTLIICTMSGTKRLSF